MPDTQPEKTTRYFDISQVGQPGIGGGLHGELGLRNDFIRETTDDPHFPRRWSPDHLPLVSAVLAHNTAAVTSTDMVSRARDTNLWWYEPHGRPPDPSCHPGNGSLGRGPMRRSPASEGAFVCYFW